MHTVNIGPRVYFGQQADQRNQPPSPFPKNPDRKVLLSPQFLEGAKAVKEGNVPPNDQDFLSRPYIDDL
jgi:hypothetical protein